MDIEEAKKLKVGDKVRFPKDRGEPSGIGIVQSPAMGEYENIHGTPYVWIGLKGGGVWPSNRLLNL